MFNGNIFFTPVFSVLFTLFFVVRSFFGRGAGGEVAIISAEHNRWHDGQMRRRYLPSGSLALVGVAKFPENFSVFIMEYYIVIAGIAVFFAAIFWLATRRNRSKFIKSFSDAALKLGSGNFEARIKEGYAGYKKEMAHVFNEMAVGVHQEYRRASAKIEERTNELEAAKAKNEAILRSISEGMIVVDSQGFFMLFNEQAKKMLGIGQVEAPIEEWPRIYGMYSVKDEEILDIRNRFFEVAMRGGTVLGGEVLIRNENQSGIVIRINVAPIVVKEFVVGAVFTFVDVTKEKDIDKAKTEFVSLASHQLRTPLSTVNWYAEMLLAGDVGELTEEQKKYVHEAYSASRRMVELVNSLLNVSRLELGTFVIEPEPTDIIKLAESVIKEQKPQISEKKLNIMEEFGGDIPLINADPKLLRIVLQNLISNAVKYTPEWGKIRVGIKHEKEEMVISVIDTGLGIPRGQQDKIFSKLFRADNVKEQDTEGTGLGLYVVKSIIDRSGGRVWFESPPSSAGAKSASGAAGTAFYVALPLGGMQKREGTKIIT